MNSAVLNSYQNPVGVFISMWNSKLESEYSSLILRLWRSPGGEAGSQDVGWCSEIEHIQSGGRWKFSTLGDLEHFLIDFLHQPDETGVAKEG